MANTIKLGNGNWATKEGSLLAYNDENNNFKPLPFTTTRASSATVVNKQGLIETVGSGIPRIDFSDDVNGALLLEGTATNFIPYSEDFSAYWDKAGSSVQGNPSTAGAEQVVNGSFATDTDWGKSGEWEISGGVASTVGTTKGGISQDCLINGLNKITFTLISGEVSIYTFYPSFGSKISYTVAGTYTLYLENQSNPTLYFYNKNAGVPASIDNVSVKEVQGFVSPDGTTNAFKLVENSSNVEHVLQTNISRTTAINTYTLSVYAKKIDRNYLTMVLYDGANGNRSWFDLANGVVGTSEVIGSGLSGFNSNITELSNGYYKCDITVTTGSTNSILNIIGVAETDGVRVYQGNGTSGVYIYGAQLEQNSYATSYIKTVGTTQTRVADTASGSGNSTVINSTEGVLYLEISALVNDSTNRFIIMNDGSSLNRLTFRYRTTSNQLSMEVHIGGIEKFSLEFNLADITLNQKVALKYKQNDYALWVNGVEVGVNTLAEIWSANTLNTVDFTGFSQDFYGKVKYLQVYTTALSDAELAILTTI